MAVVCKRSGGLGRTYLTEDGCTEPANEFITDRTSQLCHHYELRVPEALLEANPRSFDVQRYGITHQSQLYSPRQMIALLAFVAAARTAGAEMSSAGLHKAHVVAVMGNLGCLVDRVAAYTSRFCTWHNSGEKMNPTHGRQSLGMVWDYAEVNPLAGASGGVHGALNWIVQVIESCREVELPASVLRGSALRTSFADRLFDAVITDPPYYDNVSYSNLADYYYVWLSTHSPNYGNVFCL
jgi:putative DNA methylase